MEFNRYIYLYVYIYVFIYESNFQTFTEVITILYHNLAQFDVWFVPTTLHGKLRNASVIADPQLSFSSGFYR